MKTLESILWENVLGHIDLGENGCYDEMDELKKDLIDSFREFLEQWRSEIQTVDDVGQTQLEFLDELKGKLENNPNEEHKQQSATRQA